MVPDELEPEPEPPDVVPVPEPARPGSLMRVPPYLREQARGHTHHLCGKEPPGGGSAPRRNERNALAKRLGLRSAMC